MVIELHIPAAQSLKDKRRIVKSIKDRIGRHYNVSIAEIGEAEKWQSAALAITAVGNDRRILGSNMQKIRNNIDNDHAAEIINQSLEFI